MRNRFPVLCILIPTSFYPIFHRPRDGLGFAVVTATWRQTLSPKYRNTPYTGLCLTFLPARQLLKILARLLRLLLVRDSRRSFSRPPSVVPFVHLALYLCARARDNINIRLRFVHNLGVGLYGLAGPHFVVRMTTTRRSCTAAGEKSSLRDARVRPSVRPSVLPLSYSRQTCERKFTSYVTSTSRPVEHSILSSGIARPRLCIGWFLWLIVGRHIDTRSCPRERAVKINFGARDSLGVLQLRLSFLLPYRERERRPGRKMRAFLIALVLICVRLSASAHDVNSWDALYFSLHVFLL